MEFTLASGGDDWMTGVFDADREMPFLFVRLAGFGPNKSDPAEYSWADLREA